MANSQQTGNGSAVLANRAADTDYRQSGPNVDLQALPEYLKKDCLLFYYPETEALAQQIVASTPNVKLGRINWR